MQIRFALLTLLLCAPLAAADEVVFYRCTDASGALTLQNMPCPKGEKQEKKVMQGVNSMHMAAPASTPRPIVAPHATPVTPVTPPDTAAPTDAQAAVPKPSACHRRYCSSAPPMTRTATSAKTRSLPRAAWFYAPPAWMATRRMVPVKPAK